MERQYATQFTHIIPFENSIPYLYRYEDKKWIDDFFENGNIVLSSFRNYQNYKDNQLGDIYEGHSMNIVNGNNDMMVSAYTKVGLNEFCFCTSTILDEKLKGVFKRNSVFRITDPLNFMLEIARSLPRLERVLFGNCVYVNQKIISSNITKPIEMNDLKDDQEPDKINADKLMSAVSPSFNRHQFFLKNIEYQTQSEYRILWTIDKIINEGIIIYCPEARRFCDRIE
jgi:hypothetical protein